MGHFNEQGLHWEVWSALCIFVILYFCLLFFFLSLSFCHFLLSGCHFVIWSFCQGLHWEVWSALSEHERPGKSENRKTVVRLLFSGEDKKYPQVPRTQFKHSEMLLEQSNNYQQRALAKTINTICRLLQTTASSKGSDHAQEIIK